MAGKVIAIFIVLTSALAGGGLYYLQVYHFYEPVAADAAEVRLSGIVSGEPEPIPAENVEAIDASSSPIRYRACFDTPISVATLTETYQLYEGAEPLTAPDWFECYDAAQLGADLELGSAIAFLGEANIVYGIDRVVAVTDDGRGFAWHQINECGEKVFDGEPVPEGCPPPPSQ